LQTHLGVTFHTANNDQVILYSKQDPYDGSLVLVAVSFDPHIAQEASIEVPLYKLGLADDARVAVTDLMRGDRFMWYGKYQRIRLDPADLPFTIWRLEVA
jgi:starch synthase (maltosyl-transferring)